MNRKTKYRRSARKAPRKQMREQALMDARQVAPVSEGLDYKVSLDTDGDHLELFTKQPYTALLTSQALADKLQVESHVSLGARVVASKTPDRRRR